MKICVIGAGYVGLVTAVALALLKNDVICVEKDTTKLSKLILGKSTIYEKNLDKFLTLSLLTQRLSFTDNLFEAIKVSDLVFVAVGTPPQEDGSVDLSQLTSVMEMLAQSINDYKVIILKSTVPVGTQKHVKQFLINRGISSQLFDIISNPEFLREGTALDDVFYGDRIVIGYDSAKAKAIMQELYKPLEIEIVFTNPETAELIKYAANGFLATKISYINEIANLCDHVGADVEDISYAIGLDHRISPEFLQAGIGYGGSCFPKDTLALAAIGKKFGNEMKIIKSVIEVNQLQKLKPVKILQNRYSELEGRIISILGLAFKPGTDDLREAPSLYIIHELLKKGAIIKCHDPVVSTEIQKIFPSVFVFNNLYDSLDSSDCAIVCTDWSKFYSLDFELLKEKMNYPLIIDGRNLFDKDEMDKLKIEYYSIGRGSNSDSFASLNEQIKKQTLS